MKCPWEICSGDDNLGRVVVQIYAINSANVETCILNKTYLQYDPLTDRVTVNATNAYSLRVYYKTGCGAVSGSNADFQNASISGTYDYAGASTWTNI